MTKFSFTVTVDVEDTGVYELDADGHAVSYERPVEHEDMAQYVVDAVSSWGGQFAPDDPRFPTNLRSIRVRNLPLGVDLISERP